MLKLERITVSRWLLSDEESDSEMSEITWQVYIPKIVLHWKKRNPMSPFKQEASRFVTYIYRSIEHLTHASEKYIFPGALFSRMPTLKDLR